MEIRPPGSCIFCGASGPFGSVEHIVPESLGNDLLVLPAGWVCDHCNNLTSAFEGRALERSFLGAERARLKVVTKKGKPARSQFGGITWYSSPHPKSGVVEVEADWSRVPTFWNPQSRTGVFAFPMHDKSCTDISRLLLKIGVELVSVLCASGVEQKKTSLQSSIAVIRGQDGQPWPYFVLRSNAADPHLVSVLSTYPAERDYVRSCGFDLCLHQVSDQVVLFFSYGEFRAAISVTSRSLDWIQVLREWRVPFVGCPREFAEVYGD